jgi:ribonuclease D
MPKWIPIFLLRLRDNLARQLEETGCQAEARETFAEQTIVHPSSNAFDPDSFWSMTGIRDLTHRQQAIVKALFIYRDQQAQRQNRPHFKVFGDRTILELAQKAPQNLADLDSIHGMTRGQIRRYGHQVLQVIRDAQHAPLPERPRRAERRQPEAVIARYEKLHNWRKERAQARGVESDVIISRDALWALAQANPRSEAELAGIDAVGPWRRQTYAAEILQVLKD